MAKEMMYGEAMAVAIVEEMQRDADVVFYGQNMAMTERDPMLKMFGKSRVRLTPISETAEIGVAVGAAITGLRPVVELWMSEFMLVAMDQVLNEAPRLRYMSGGQVKVPLVLKAGYGFAAGWGGQHSNCIYHTMMGIPGLKVALPSTPADAKGLMAAAIRDDNPVVYLHHYMLTLDTGDVPEGEHILPFGVADIKRTGNDVTIVATGWMVKKSLAAAEQLAREGISAEVIDPRTLAPLDVDTMIKSVKKTGRLVLVDQAPRQSSAAAVIAAEVAEMGFEHLRAPIILVTALDAPVPYSEPLESYLLPNEDKIVQAVRSMVTQARPKRADQNLEIFHSIRRPT
ncbi:MAG: transketolase C-terminal domain-containing protein [Terriglobales bacterium]